MKYLLLLMAVIVVGCSTPQPIAPESEKVFPTSEYAGTWTNEPRDPGVTLTVDENLNYTLTLNEGHYYWVICRDTSVALLTDYSTTGKVSWNNGGFNIFYEDTTGYFKRYVIGWGTINDTLTVVHIRVTVPPPCNIKKDFSMWLRRVE